MLVFSMGTTTLCTAITKASGVATCLPGVISSALLLLDGSYTATFAGSHDYLRSSGSARVTLV